MRQSEAGARAARAIVPGGRPTGNQPHRRSLRPMIQERVSFGFKTAVAVFVVGAFGCSTSHAPTTVSAGSGGASAAPGTGGSIASGSGGATGSASGGATAAPGSGGSAGTGTGGAGGATPSGNGGS